jgi:hypothetical protein
MALGIEMLVERMFLGAGGIVWDHGNSALFGDGLPEVISVVSGIGHYDIGMKPFDQGSRLRRITAMSCGQSEPNGAS